MKSDDKKFNNDVQELAQTLTLHIAAMKPIYLNKKEVPEEVKQKELAGESGEKALWKMFVRDVLMEQELATSEESIKVKQLIRERESELSTPLSIKEWALFHIGG